MQLRARETVFWPGINKEIMEIAKACEVCQVFSRSQQRETLMSHEIPQSPWEKLGIDFFEFQSQQYLLIVDYYSRFPVIRRASNTTYAATINIIKEVLSEYGIPKICMTDNGPQFTSKEFHDFSHEYCFEHITSSKRYPKSNGLVKRMVQTVKQTMKKCITMKEDLHMAMLTYRITPLATNIPAPAELLNGRKYSGLLPAKTVMHNAKEQPIYEQMLENKVKQADYYNKSSRELPPLQKNQAVYVQTNPEVNKWTHAVVARTPTNTQPRSCTVETENGAQLQRNRCYIKPEPGENIRERSRRKISRPQILIATI